MATNSETVTNRYPLVLSSLVISDRASMVVGRDSWHRIIAPGADLVALGHRALEQFGMMWAALLPITSGFWGARYVRIMVLL